MIKITAVGLRVVDKLWISDDFCLIKTIDTAIYIADGKQITYTTPVVVILKDKISCIFQYIDVGDEIHVHGEPPNIAEHANKENLGVDFSLVIYATDIRFGRKYTEILKLNGDENTIPIPTNNSIH